MSLIVLFEPKAAPGKERELEAMLAETLPNTRAFEGCESGP
jgi:quinol monooxygenase YgiN